MKKLSLLLFLLLGLPSLAQKQPKQPGLTLLKYPCTEGLPKAPQIHFNAFPIVCRPKPEKSYGIFPRIQPV